ncbi:MAG TPA: multicopper oxidase family protein [Gemmatimonadales bacterium]|nr:multicopper oxidase family protein [Gemmatimonadales bacterium]
MAEGTLAPGADLFCMALFPRAEFPTASGTVELRRVPSPFDLAISKDGHTRYALTATLVGLPASRSGGSRTTYVAWVTTPTLSPMIKLGEVGNGRIALGLVDLDKFLIFVTAEASAVVTERAGPLVLRGTSPSMRLDRHDLLMLAGGGAASSNGPGAMEHQAGHGPGSTLAWVMPPDYPGVSMPMAGFAGLTPPATPFLPGLALGRTAVPAARPRQALTLADGDTLTLEATLVRRVINGRPLVMYAYNGQYPGPLLKVTQGSTIAVRFRNGIDQPTAVHWHGIRLDNPFDGAPGVTQEAVPPGGTFLYQVHFPDAGVYWYHSHVREDVEQGLGLYGNVLVAPRARDYYDPVNREAVLMLDDLMMGDGGLLPYGRDTPTHAIMGRFGNVLLVNGEPRYQLAVQQGEVVRFFLTDVSSVRTYNLSFGDAAMKLVAADLGKFEREAWVESVVIAPAERYVVEVRFDRPGDVALTNRVLALDHRYGTLFDEVDTLGVVHVARAAVAPDYRASFERLREQAAVRADIARYRPLFNRPVDHELVLTLRTRDLPFPLERLLQLDRPYFPPLEWTGTMPMMDWLATGQQTEWILKDPATGRENMAIGWHFRQGDVVKLRVDNDRTALHAMQHPIHLHGQRFLVLAENGVPNDDLAWKDTVLIPAGWTIDLLVEMSNPGRWMLHCHIGEHLESGMHTVVTVDAAAPSR